MPTLGLSLTSRLSHQSSNVFSACQYMALIRRTSQLHHCIRPTVFRDTNSLTISMCSFASFTGRPPLLSKTFMTIPWPLDLTDDDLFAGNSVLKEIAAATTDQNGWSTRGHFTAATSYRTRAMLKTIREDILTISLGKQQNASIDTLL